jgi:hypothetical protein
MIETKAMPSESLKMSTTTLAVAVFVSAVLAQTLPTGRIAGRITDRESNELPGVEVTLTSNGLHRSISTDSAGRFAFDALDAARLYTVSAELTGFKNVVREGVTVGSGQTATVDFAMRVCLGFGTADYAEPPLLDRLLMAAAVVHLRIAEAGHKRLIETDEYCGVVDEARATILEVGRLSRDEWRSLATIDLTSDSLALKAGAEYLAFLSYDVSTRRFVIDESGAWKVSGARVDGLDELGIRNGTAVSQALTQLRDTYRLRRR